MEITKKNGEKYNVETTSDAFCEGYMVGLDHPSFVTGNTLKEAPESDDLNPYEKESNQYYDWRIGFNSAIL